MPRPLLCLCPQLPASLPQSKQRQPHPSSPQLHPGCYAEYVAAPQGWLARVSAALPLEQVAGLPLVGLTAWDALTAAKPQEGQRVLIHSSSGGVGHVAVQVGYALGGWIMPFYSTKLPSCWACMWPPIASFPLSHNQLLSGSVPVVHPPLQLAKVLGLHVTAVCGPSNVEFVKSLGADEVVDYSQGDWTETYASNPFDIVIDMRGTRSELLFVLVWRWPFFMRPAPCISFLRCGAKGMHHSLQAIKLRLTHARHCTLQSRPPHLARPLPPPPAAQAMTCSAASRSSSPLATSATS